MPDPLAEFLRDTFDVPVQRGDGWVFVHREHVDDPETKFDALHRALVAHPEWIGGRKPRIFDFTIKKTALGESNIIPPGFGAEDESGAIAGVHYRDVAGALTDAERSFDDDGRTRLVLEPFAERAAGLATFHIDHHYDVPALTFVTTTTLVLDFVRHLRSTGRTELLARLQDTFGIVDHSDADMVFSHAVLAHARDDAWIDRHADRLRAATIRNDYAVLPAEARARDEAERLYHFAIELERCLRDGECDLDDAFARVDRAVDVLAAGDEAAATDRAWFDDAVRAGGRLTREAEDLLARLADGYRRFDTVPHTVVDADLTSPSLRRLGPVLAVIGEADGGLVESAEIVAAVQRGALSGVESTDDPPRVVVTGSRVDDGYLVKIRTLVGSRGAMNLVPVFRRLNEHAAYKHLSPGGRRIAGGLCKRPVPDLDVCQAVLDVAREIESITNE